MDIDCCKLYVHFCAKKLAEKLNLKFWQIRHQHFLSSFCSNMLAPKKYKSVRTKKLHVKLKYEKALRKTLVKLTTGRFTHIHRLKFTTHSGLIS
jgi:hypothetical protein